jgi:hypothetical protein
MGSHGAPGFDERGQGGSDGPNCRVEIETEPCCPDVVPAVERIAERLVRHNAAACIVDQDIEPGNVGQDGLDHPLWAVSRGEVGGNESGSSSSELRRDTPRRRDDPCTLLLKRPNDRETYALAGACDQYALADELKIHHALPGEKTQAS